VCKSPVGRWKVDCKMSAATNHPHHQVQSAQNSINSSNGRPRSSTGVSGVRSAASNDKMMSESRLSMSPNLMGSTRAETDSVQTFDPDAGFGARRRSSSGGQPGNAAPSSASLPQAARQAVTGDDPLSAPNFEAPKIRTESLTIRQSDESRIVSAMATASKKQTTGAVFSVKVDLGHSGALGIGVKDLSGNMLAVSMLKRANGEPGAGEAAGVRLGDVIFGVNFIAVREGSRTLLSVLKRENERRRKSVHLQCWRCHQLCSDPIPGAIFSRADDVIVQAYALFRNNVFSDWERWNFVEILLSHMLDEMKLRASLESMPARPEFVSQQQARIRAKQHQIIDLEKNILQAKGLRTALCVRIVHTKSIDETVIYVLRVEDIETGLQWVVHRRYRDFYALNTELSDLSSYTKEVTFPNKRISLRIQRDRLIEQRVVGLEQFIRRVLHTLTMCASTDPSASRSLRHLQNFLGVDKYIDCIHPPPIDDQRYIELMAFRLLNDFNAPACSQCIRFVANIDLESLIDPTSRDGFKAMLAHVAQALSEVETFMLNNYQQQMEQSLADRNQKMSKDQVTTFVRRCVRRQVEAAIYLPLRRQILKLIFPFINGQAHEMQHALHMLQQANPKFFTIDPIVPQAKCFPRAIKSFREVIHAYLPADQGQLLMHAAGAVMELYSETVATKEQQAYANSLMSDPTAAVNPSANAVGSSNSGGSAAARRGSGHGNKATNASVGRSRSSSSQGSGGSPGKMPTPRNKSTDSEDEDKKDKDVVKRSSKRDVQENLDTVDAIADPSTPVSQGITRVKSAQLAMLLVPRKLDMLLETPSGDEHQQSQSHAMIHPSSDELFAEAGGADANGVKNSSSNESIELQQVDIAHPHPIKNIPNEMTSSTIPPATMDTLDSLTETTSKTLQAVAEATLFEELEMEKSRTESLAHLEGGQNALLAAALSDCAIGDSHTKGGRASADLGDSEGPQTGDEEEPNIRSSILSAGSDKEGIFGMNTAGFYDAVRFSKCTELECS
jgi:hypothetical protein